MSEKEFLIAPAETESPRKATGAAKVPSAYYSSGHSSTSYHDLSIQPVVVSRRSFVAPKKSSDKVGTSAKNYAVVATFIIAFSGCFWALPFTVVGVALGIISISKDEAGDRQGAMSYFIKSVITTTVGVVTAIMGAIQFVVYVMLRLKHIKDEQDNYY